MIAERAFFSFTEIPDAADHRAYNEWHQLDHRPENLALPGVVHGERWVRSPDCTVAAPAQGLLAPLHYVNMYWFARPVDETVSAWQELAERSFQWGRRDDVRLARRLLMGFFRPVSGWAAPRVRVSCDALPFRPNRGIHIDVRVSADPRSAATERRNAWWQHDYIPAQLGRDGVAGCWTFASESNFTQHADLATDATTGPSTRITVFYLDEDPIAVSRTLDPVGDVGDDSETMLVRSPLLAITPWLWDWFDAQPLATP